jgi:hypothetical protein
MAEIEALTPSGEGPAVFFSGPLFARLSRMLLAACLRRHFRRAGGDGGGDGAFAMSCLRVLLHAAALAEHAVAARLRSVAAAAGGAQDSPLLLQARGAASAFFAAAKAATAAFVTQCPSLPPGEAVAMLCAPLGAPLAGEAEGGGGTITVAARTSRYAAGVANHCLSRAAALRPPLRALAADALIALAVDGTVLD